MCLKLRLGAGVDCLMVRLSGGECLKLRPPSGFDCLTVRLVSGRLRNIERAFRGAHRVAYIDWRSGLRETVFPFGTWGMVEFHGARVEAVRPE
jgi:hypothetical protein